MKITAISLHPVVVERRYGTVIAREGGKAKQKVTKSYFFFLEARTDLGLTGWGEVSDIVPEDLPKKRDEYRMTLSDLLVGRDPFDLQQIHKDVCQHLDVANSSLARFTECAIDMAMHDLQGKATKRPVCQLLGGKVRKDVRISWVAYIREDLDLRRCRARFSSSPTTRSTTCRAPSRIAARTGSCRVASTWLSEASANRRAQQAPLPFVAVAELRAFFVVMPISKPTGKR